MTLNELVNKIHNNETLNFDETLATINANYAYQPTAFRNGELANAAGQNEGSCRVFAFGQLQNLTEAQTLALFGEHYRDVLATPEGTNHGNIRQFMQHGWAGIEFDGRALSH